jgi:hypothetical protein
MSDSKNSETQNKPAVKRGPGRPPIDTNKVNVERIGVVKSPISANNSVEFNYAIPSVFKKLFSIFKSTNVSDIYLSFNLENASMFAKSFSEQIYFKVEIDCKKVHRYYCDRPVDLKLNRETTEKISNRINPKFFNEIIMIVKKYTDEVDHMIFQLKNPMLDSVSTHKMNLTSNIEIEDNNNWDTSEYPLNFTLTNQDFKKYISDIEQISSTVMIEKVGTNPLVFRYTKEGGVLSGTEVFNNNKKIKLNCSNGENDIIAATVKISNIKPLSNAQISDNITLFIDNHKDMILSIKMDDAITLKILIKIENYQELK